MNQQDLMELRIRAEAGEALALFHLGRCYYEGVGVVQDFKQAMQWFEGAAVMGDVRAQSILGVMLYRGQGVAQDYEEGCKYR